MGLSGSKSVPAASAAPVPKEWIHTPAGAGSGIGTETGTGTGTGTEDEDEDDGVKLNINVRSLMKKPTLTRKGIHRHGEGFIVIQPVADSVSEDSTSTPETVHAKVYAFGFWTCFNLSTHLFKTSLLEFLAKQKQTFSVDGIITGAVNIAFAQLPADSGPCPNTYCESSKPCCCCNSTLSSLTMYIRNANLLPVVVFNFKGSHPSAMDPKTNVAFDFDMVLNMPRVRHTPESADIMATLLHMMDMSDYTAEWKHVIKEHALKMVRNMRGKLPAVLTRITSDEALSTVVIPCHRMGSVPQQLATVYVAFPEDLPEVLKTGFNPGDTLHTFTSTHFSPVIVKLQEDPYGAIAKTKHIKARIHAVLKPEEDEDKKMETYSLYSVDQKGNYFKVGDTVDLHSLGTSFPLCVFKTQEIIQAIQVVETEGAVQATVTRLTTDIGDFVPGILAHLTAKIRELAEVHLSVK